MKGRSSYTPFGKLRVGSGIQRKKRVGDEVKGRTVNYSNLVPHHWCLDYFKGLTATSLK
jgi:hypothetical protein